MISIISFEAVIRSAGADIADGFIGRRMRRCSMGCQGI